MTESPTSPGAPYRTPGERPYGTIAFFAATLVGLLGIALSVLGSWMQGVVGISAALVLAGAARLALPDRMAGLLRVRRKSFDVVLLFVLGIGTFVVFLTHPDV
jgi:Protein of unknown function (DUF3017)